MESKKVSCKAYVKHIVSLEMKLCIYVDKYVPWFGSGLFEWRLKYDTASYTQSSMVDEDTFEVGAFFNLFLEVKCSEAIFKAFFES